MTGTPAPACHLACRVSTTLSAVVIRGLQSPAAEATLSRAGPPVASSRREGHKDFGRPTLRHRHALRQGRRQLVPPGNGTSIANEATPRTDEACFSWGRQSAEESWDNNAFTERHTGCARPASCYGRRQTSSPPCGALLAPPCGDNAHQGNRRHMHRWARPKMLRPANPGKFRCLGGGGGFASRHIPCKT